MSSGNGGGSGFFDNLIKVESFSGEGNFFENLFSDSINRGLQGVTAGIIGYEDGKISNGVSTNVIKKMGKEVVSGTKEITGAKAAEEANDVARSQFEQAKADAEAARKNSQEQTARDQTRQSNMAGSARRKASASRGANKSNILGTVSTNTEQDFLGL